LPFPSESLIRGREEEAAKDRLSDHVAKLIKVQSLFIVAARGNQLSAGSFRMMRETSPSSDVFPGNSYVMFKKPEGCSQKDANAKG
jgi:hypothetical protein